MARGFLPYDLDQQYLLPPASKSGSPRSTWPSSSPMWPTPGSVGHHAGILERRASRPPRVSPGPGSPSSSSTAMPRQGLLAQTERATYEEAFYRVLAATATLTTTPPPLFRKRHLSALAGLFTQVLRLCQQAGLVKLGHVALDGSKLKASAPSTRP